MASPLPKPSLPGQVFPPKPGVLPKLVPNPQVKQAVPLPGQLPKPPVVKNPPPPPPSTAVVPSAATKPGVAPLSAAQKKPSATSQSFSPPVGLGNKAQVAPIPSETPKTDLKPAKSAVFAKAKKSPLKFLPILLGGLVLLVVLIIVVMRFFGGSSNQSVSVSQDSGTAQSGQGGVGVGSGKQTILTYWGLWETNAVVEEVLEDFSQQNPGVIVEYKKHSHTEYRERLQSAIAAGNGPDVFRFHASWTPMLRAELDVAASSVISAEEFKKIFYPVAAEQLVEGNRVLGVPLMYDGLALYYNKKALNTANVDVPNTWSELKTAANKLTIRSDGKIERAGVALGTAGNVEHFSDVLALLMLQNGASLDAPSTKEAQQALQFYTDFYSKSQVWDETLANSTIAFAKGDVAMMFAPSWRAHEVMALNPDLDFDIAPVPKLTEARVAWASFWAEGVSSQSKNKDLAWKLISHLSSEDVLKQLYSSQSQTRSFGEIYPRMSMAGDLIDAKYVSAYLEDAPVATSWYLNSFTHDNGLNDRIISYYEDAVTAVVSGSETNEVMDLVASGSAQVLRQYGAGSSSR